MTVSESQQVFIPALCVFREMRGESSTARLGCLWTIKNRAADQHNRWPKDLYGVVTQPYQFSSFNSSDPNSSLMPTPKKAADWKAWEEIAAMCDAPGPDPTGGANMYEALPASAPKPGWVSEAQLLITIGNTRFYKL